MSQYTAAIIWERSEAVFTDGRFSRAHRWLFDGGIQVPVSASPHLVPPPFSVAEAVDPEELVLDAYEAVRTLRLVFANHAAAGTHEVPEWLFKGEIWTQ